MNDISNFISVSISLLLTILKLHLYHLLSFILYLQKHITRRKNVLKKLVKLYLKAISLMLLLLQEKKKLIKEFLINIETRLLSKSLAKYLINVYVKHKKHLLFNILYDAIK